jgi:FkbM family methyltransferase
LFDRLSRGEATFVDVGAYLGDFAVALALALPRLRVVAVEASRPTFAALDRIVGLFGLRARVTPVCCAASDASGRSQLKTALVAGAPSPMGASLYAGDLPGLEGADYAHAEVETARMDEVLRAHPGRLVVKVDVEGAELAALRGLEGALERCDLLLVELWHYDEVRPARDGTIAWLVERGFRCHVVEPDGSLAAFDAAADLRTRGRNPVYANYAFLPRDSGVRSSA